MLCSWAIIFCSIIINMTIVLIKNINVNHCYFTVVSLFIIDGVSTARYSNFFFILLVIQRKGLLRMPKFRTGAPVTLTEELHNRLIRLSFMALKQKRFANLVCVHPNNLRRWLKKGSDVNQSRVEF